MCSDAIVCIGVRELEKLTLPKSTSTRLVIVLKFSSVYVLRTNFQGASIRFERRWLAAALAVSVATLTRGMRSVRRPNLAICAFVLINAVSSTNRMDGRADHAIRGHLAGRAGHWTDSQLAVTDAYHSAALRARLLPRCQHRETGAFLSAFTVLQKTYYPTFNDNFDSSCPILNNFWYSYC